jgi:nucleotide-binding universal stress UspA family protein
MSEAIKEDQNNSEGRPCVLLVVDRTARHRSAAAAARTVATALQADLVEVEVGRGGDPTALHNPVATILNAAEQLSGMIVVGSGGGSLLAGLVHGELFGAVLRRAQCPILVASRRER